MSSLDQFSALVLAAGLSSRMSKKGNKLLLPYQGRTILSTTLNSVRQMGFLEIILVTGHQNEEIENEALQPPFRESIRCVFNQDYESGMQSSIQAGVRTLNKDSLGFAIFLADQPAYETESLRRYLEIAATKILSQQSQIACPIFNGQTGHPVLFSTKYRDEILSQPASDQGCNYLLKRHAAQVSTIEVDAGAFTLDIDDESAYAEVVN